MNKNLKGLNYDPNPKPFRPVPAVQIVLIMLAILLVLWGLDAIGLLNLLLQTEFKTK